MARIRSIHPGLASDEAYMTMSMAAKAAWPLLWTECDDHGIFEWKPIVLKARIFPADTVDFTAVLGEYEALGSVKRVEIAGKPYGLIHNFGKYQRPKNPSYRHEWSEDFASFTGFTVALPQPSPSPTEKSPQMKEEGGKREEGIGKELTKPALDSERESAPRAASRAPARKAPKTKLKTKIAEDQQPTENDRRYADGTGMTLDVMRVEWPKFRDYHLANGTLSASWEASWRTWCQRIDAYAPTAKIIRMQPQARNASEAVDECLAIIREEQEKML